MLLNYLTNCSNVVECVNDGASVKYFLDAGVSLRKFVERLDSNEDINSWIK